MTDPELIQQVLNGNYVLVYGSPKCLLSTESWRRIFDCESLKGMFLQLRDAVSTYVFVFERSERYIQTLNGGDYVESFSSLHEQYSLVTLFYNMTA